MGIIVCQQTPPRCCLAQCMYVLSLEGNLHWEIEREEYRVSFDRDIELRISEVTQIGLLIK